MLKQLSIFAENTKGRMQEVTGILLREDINILGSVTNDSAEYGIVRMVVSKVSLKHLEAPCILYNLNGYYNSLKELLEHMIEKGLSTKERQEGIYFAENLEEIKQILMKIEK